MTSSLYLLFKAIKQDATVALSGESADEVFGGYPWFHNEAILQAPTFPWLAAFHGSMQNANAWLSEDIVQKVRPNEHIETQYRKIMAEVPRLEGETGLDTRRREMFYMNQNVFLPFLLERKDRTSMATGFEARVPFCDYRLVQYAWNIPWRMKMVDGIEKGILRRAFSQALPDDVRNRKKSAYPSAQSPVYEQATREWTLRILNNVQAPIQPLLNSQHIHSLGENYKQPPLALVSLYERIIQLNEWLDTYDVTLAF